MENNKKAYVLCIDAKHVPMLKEGRVYEVLKLYTYSVDIKMGDDRNSYLKERFKIIENEIEMILFGGE